MIEVTAAILECDNKILLARRKAGKHLAGYWEFPGGKVEDTETPEQSLHRELKEEFSIDIRINHFIGESTYDYPTQKIKLIGFTAEIIGGEITLSDHDLIEWINLDQIKNYLMAPADIPLIKFYRDNQNNI